MNLKSIFYNLLAIFLIFISLYFFVSPQDWNILKQVSITNFLIIIIITLIIYVLSGLEYYCLIYAQSKKRLTTFDIITLPIAMNLWSLIIPFQGALIYSTAYLKYAYQTTIATGIATNLFSYLISIFLTGVTALLLSLYSSMGPIPILISIIFILSPALLIMVNKLTSYIPDTKVPTLNKVITQLSNIIKSINKLISKPKTILIVFVLNIIHTVAAIFWHYYIAISLNLSIPILAIIVFTLCLRLSIILKLTPGNVGLQEILAGAIFNLFGFNAAHGVLITLMTRVTSLLLMCSIGIFATVRSINSLKLFNE